jgi:hypothetical protein
LNPLFIWWLQVSYIPCRRCGSRIQVAVRLRSRAPAFFATTCPACGFGGVYSYVDIVEEGVYRARCAVCDVRLYSFRLGPARCPVCRSRYEVAVGGWRLVERGDAKPGPVAELATMGFYIGGAGGAKGRNAHERIAGSVAGAIAGLILGALLGSHIEALTRTEREVVYE